MFHCFHFSRSQDYGPGIAVRSKERDRFLAWHSLRSSSPRPSRHGWCGITKRLASPFSSAQTSALSFVWATDLAPMAHGCRTTTHRKILSSFADISNWGSLITWLHGSARQWILFAPIIAGLHGSASSASSITGPGYHDPRKFRRWHP